jgi:ABC-2 type transport system ATP-binding protein
MTAAVVFENVRKQYGRVVAVNRVDLTLPTGCVVGLIGHNGAGKSTCLQMLSGLVRPTEGRVLVDGVDVVAEPLAARERLGVVSEEPALYEYLSAREFLEFVAEVRGVDALDEALALCALGADADRLIREYSQGMRRRTAIAAALIGRPPVLVLDEALNGLDPIAAARVKEALRDARSRGQTVVLSTHVVETVQSLADRVVMLGQGNVIADTTTDGMQPGELERLFLSRLETHDNHATS